MKFNGEVFVYIKNAVLATFTFISGYMLRKYKFSSWHEVLVFYRKRVLRFYPLFLLSALSLFIMHWMDVKQLLFGIGGLAMFTSTPVKTLWYISMLMLLYAITPLILINQICNKRWCKILVYCLLAVLLIVLYNRVIIDERLMRYMPIYVLGLYINDLHFNRKQWLLIAIGSIVVIIGFWLCNIDRVILSCIIALFGAAFLIAFGFFLPIKAIEKPIHFFAYNSMAAYLFHRQIFGVALFLFGIRGFGEPYLPIWVALITLIVVFVVSWAIQLVYDKIISHVL